MFLSRRTLEGAQDNVPIAKNIKGIGKKSRRREREGHKAINYGGDFVKELAKLKLTDRSDSQQSTMTGQLTYTK